MYAHETVRNAAATTATVVAQTTSPSSSCVALREQLPAFQTFPGFPKHDRNSGNPVYPSRLCFCKTPRPSPLEVQLTRYRDVLIFCTRSMQSAYGVSNTIELNRLCKTFQKGPKNHYCTRPVLKTLEFIGHHGQLFWISFRKRSFF